MLQREGGGGVGGGGGGGGRGGRGGMVGEGVYRSGKGWKAIRRREKKGVGEEG